MNPSIHNELAKLQEELSTLDKAVKHISKAEKIATSVVNATNSVQQAYTSHLKNLQDLLEESVSRIQQDINNSLESFHADSKTVFTEHQAQINELSSLLENYRNLVSHSQNVIEEMNFSNQLHPLTEEVKKLKKKLEHQDKEISMMKGILLLLLALSLSTVVILFLR
jgi:chromosome segregation ATPase